MSEAPDQSPEADVDLLLRQADPEFHASLEAVRAVENASDVHIEASVLDLDASADDEAFDRQTKGEAAEVTPTARLISLRTLPKEVIGYALGQIRSGLHAFKAATRAQKVLLVLLVAVAGLITYLTTANLRGTWLPRFDRPMLTGFAPYADHVEDFDPAEDQVSLRAEFPPDVHEFLFKPFKVNLRATTENPQPMGAFEFVVTLDAKETAIEARDREVEMVDLIPARFRRRNLSRFGDRTWQGTFEVAHPARDQCQAVVGSRDRRQF